MIYNRWGKTTSFHVQHTQGTLIGAFLSSQSVLLASDTLIHGTGGFAGQKKQKIYRTGPRSVAALQGQYFYATDHGPEAQLLDVFVGRANQLAAAETEHFIVQARVLAESIGHELQQFLDHIPANAFTPPNRENRPDHHICYVVVAGWEDHRSIARFYRVAVVREDRWRVYIMSRPNLDQVGCGLRFIGNDSAIWNVLNDPSALRRQEIRNIAHVDRALKGDCSTFTGQIGRGLFIDAVRLTVDHGAEFGIPVGRVGGDLEFVEVGSGGIVCETLCEIAWQKNA